MADTNSILWQAADEIRARLGNADLFCTKVSLNSITASLGNRIDAVSVFADTKASKVSLGSVKSALEALVDLRATQVSLATTETVLEGLIDLRATQASLGAAQVSIGSLDPRGSILEGGGGPPRTLPSHAVTWTILTEIALSGEKIVNNEFSNTSGSTGSLTLDDWTVISGSLDQTQLAAGIVQGTGSLNQLPSYSLPTTPNNGHATHHTFAVADRPLAIALVTQTVNGIVLTAGDAFKIKKVNVNTNAADLVQVNGSNIGWAGIRGVEWEVAEEVGGTYPFGVVIQQEFSTPIPAGTKLIAKVTRADSESTIMRIRAIYSNSETNYDIDPAVGQLEFEVPAGKTLDKVRVVTQTSTRSVTDVSLIQGVMAGGSVQASGSTLEKISGADGWNAGASSTAYIGGNSDGYVQFQYAVASKALKVGLVTSDVDFAEADPYELKIDTNGSVDTDGTSQPAGFASQGDWFRIRHYASSNEIKFQRKQEIFENGVSVGFDYVNFHTHSTLTSGSNLFVDTSFYHNTARINDVTLVS